MPIWRSSVQRLPSSPSCRFSIGRLPRHTALSDVIRCSLQSTGMPALLEHAGLDGGDGNRPDGITLLPYARGKSLIWDATCIDTFSPSNMIRSAILARADTNEAESRKLSKYASPTNRFDLQPIAVETSRVFVESTLVYLCNLESRIASAMGNVREPTWLIQRISLAVVKGNAISINNNNNGYFKVLFLRRAHSPFINKINNGVNIQLGKTNSLKALCMMQINTRNKQTMCQ